MRLLLLQLSSDPRADAGTALQCCISALTPCSTSPSPSPAASPTASPRSVPGTLGLLACMPVSLGVRGARTCIYNHAGSSAVFSLFCAHLQFGPGNIQLHGFARNVDWRLAGASDGAGSPSVTLVLNDSEYSRAMWPHAFQVAAAGAGVTAGHRGSACNSRSRLILQCRGNTAFAVCIRTVPAAPLLTG